MAGFHSITWPNLLLQTSLIREATLMRKLQHLNVLQLHTSFVVGRELWLVMPYMAHGSVRSIMKKQGLTQVCSRLADTALCTSCMKSWCADARRQQYAHHKQHWCAQQLMQPTTVADVSGGNGQVKHQQC